MQFGRTSTTTVVETNMVTYQNIFPPPQKKKIIVFSPNFHFGKDKDATKLHMF